MFLGNVVELLPSLAKVVSEKRVTSVYTGIGRPVGSQKRLPSPWIGAVTQRNDLSSLIAGRAIDKLVMGNDRADVHEEGLLGPPIHLVLAHRPRLDEKG